MQARGALGEKVISPKVKVRELGRVWRKRKEEVGFSHRGVCVCVCVEAFLLDEKRKSTGLLLQSFEYKVKYSLERSWSLLTVIVTRWTSQLDFKGSYREGLIKKWWIPHLVIDIKSYLQEDNMQFSISMKKGMAQCQFILSDHDCVQQRWGRRRPSPIPWDAVGGQS